MRSARASLRRNPTAPATARQVPSSPIHSCPQTLWKRRVRELPLLMSMNTSLAGNEGLVKGNRGLGSRLGPVCETRKPNVPISTGMSAIEHCRDDQPATDQQREGDTADDRQSSMSAIRRFAAGSGTLRRRDADPEITRAHELTFATFVSPREKCTGPP